MEPQATVIGPNDGESVELTTLGVRYMLDGERTGGGFSLVEHPLAPRALAAPMHRHKNEDEYSYVTDGRVGAKLGDEVVFGEVGDLILKPRGQWHTFWNAGDEPARLLEIISPAGFERYFAEISEIVSAGVPPDRERMSAVQAKYELEVDIESVPGLVKEHGVRFPGFD
jgi:mannose-6-phosphate isomerase-like protein (cupin superfamily)